MNITSQFSHNLYKQTQFGIAVPSGQSGRKGTGLGVGSIFGGKRQRPASEASGLLARASQQAGKPPSVLLPDSFGASSTENHQEKPSAVDEWLSSAH